MSQVLTLPPADNMDIDNEPQINTEPTNNDDPMMMPAPRPALCPSPQLMERFSQTVALAFDIIGPGHI